MNELLLIIHTLFIVGGSLAALYMGREALVSWICLLTVFVNIFVTKQIALFSLYATPTDALAIGIGLSLNLMQEYYGKQLARKAIWISFAAAIACTVLACLHLSYVPSSYDTMHHHAYKLFGIMPRIIAASLITFLISQYCEYFLYALLKKYYKGKRFIIRNYASSMAAQLLDTVLFSFLGLYGIVESLWSVMVISYCIKLFVIAIATPFLLFSKKIMVVKNHESISL
jgi:queuosine precursor transporter